MNKSTYNGQIHSLRAEKILSEGNITVCTDKGEITLPVEGAETDWAKLNVKVTNKGGKTFYRTLTVFCKSDLTLYEIRLSIPSPKEENEFVFYKTFINAPAAAFVRCGKRGFYTGVENPFFTAEKKGGRITLIYQPSLILKAGEVYESEPQFLGEYETTGEYVYGRDALCLEGMQHKRIRPRFFNPSEEIPLDKAEIKAMREYVYEYYNVIEQDFENILYFYFYPKLQFPKNEEEISDYLDTVDRFKRIKGSIIAFNQLEKTLLPTDNKPYWELCPENSAAERIYNYAKEKGLRRGFYMGCGNRNEGGNSALLPFAPEKSGWKKRDMFGNAAAENCLGCDEYLEWWYDVQKNTIEKYDLGYWAWDPGPGNGNDCYAENHGHIPGKGEYKGWRNSEKLLKRIKARFPKLFLQSFYGRKEYGIWGFRYFSQHEVYWEQTLLFGATLHNDFNDYRMNAHGTRLQNMWSMNYRFLPAHIGHGLVTRMGESYYDSSLEKANDLYGWKYSLISAIACCGSVTHCNLPDRLENVPGMVEFYDKWISWAKENYRFCKFTTPISENVENGIIDGFSRVCGDEGQLFLFNSAPLTVKKHIVLNEKLGLSTEKSFYLRVLYCENMETNGYEIDFGGKYSCGDTLEITLPPYGALALEIAKTPGDKSIKDVPSYNHKIDCFFDQDNEPIKITDHGDFDQLTVTSSFELYSELKEKMDEIFVPNEAFINEKTSVWREQKLPFTLLSSTPNKLIAYIPFSGAEKPETVKLNINGADVPVEVFFLRNVPFIHYAYLDGKVRFDAENEVTLTVKGLKKNSFMGIFISYPDVCNGLNAPKTVIEETEKPGKAYPDSTLTISSIEVSPDVFDDVDTEYTVTVKTDVPPERIDAVFCILPTTPRMPALFYNRESGAWQGRFRSGNRRANIFVNKEIVAWIRARDGGIGPKVSREIKTRFVYKKEN